MGTGYNEQQSYFRAIHVAIFNMMRDVSTQSLCQLQYSAVDKDLDKELAMIHYQVTTRLLTGYILCAQGVLMCAYVYVCMHMCMYVCVHVYAFMIVHIM